jgi:hypothetical protein
MSKKIQVLDICLPDYFTGYSKTVIQIPIYQKSFSCEDMAHEIENEINMVWEMMEETHTEDELVVWDNYIDELKKQGSEIFYEDRNYIDTSDDDMAECAYIYFGLTNPTTVNGLTFLNP